MKNLTRHTGKLELIQRMKSSINGNPRFLVSIDGTTCQTSVDSMHGYTVQNLEGKEVTATIGTYYGKATLDDIAEVQA